MISLNLNQQRRSKNTILYLEPFCWNLKISKWDEFWQTIFLSYNCVPQGNQMGSNLEIWYENIPSKLISTHSLSLASLSFLLSLTTTSVYAIAKTLKLHTKCSLWACCCIIMSIVLWSFKLWVKMFDHFFVEEYMTCWLGKNRNYIQNALPLQVVVSSWQLYWEAFIPGYILNS